MEDKINYATEFINSTGGHLFLTGKAGTGKTTFLRQLGAHCHKNFVVLAPTGVAALNAGGVTIHSQFLLPFGSFLPGDRPANSPAGALFYTGRDLSRQHPLDARRRKVLQAIDMLVIDEVSMCRADLIDALDYRLRTLRRNRRPFGGVQLLMIGDLFQLPPIVRDHEWDLLKQYYSSIHFFEARALKQAGFTYLELDKVFRQSDDRFVRLLNNLRSNNCSAEDLKLLNSRYQRNARAEEGVITLVTHNRQADAINRKRLDELEGAPYYYEADIEGNFPESMQPLPLSLELKVGAQVMFIKNDPEGDRFYNGKIACVSALEEDSVWVSMEGEDNFLVPRLQWQNRRYESDEKTGDLREELLGSFEQYPLRLAWAVTVHKSQGLTFEKAVVDVGQAFAPGQVYVALSRLRSLEGLSLRTEVSPSVISNDREVHDFVHQVSENTDLVARLKEERRRFLAQSLMNAFDFSPLHKGVDYMLKKFESKLNFEDEYLRGALGQYRLLLAEEEANSRKFQAQLQQLLAADRADQVLERLERGSQYYRQKLSGWLQQLLIFAEAVSELSGTKALSDQLSEQAQLLAHQYYLIDMAAAHTKSLLAAEAWDQSEQFQKRREAWYAEQLTAARQALSKMDLQISNKSGRKRAGTKAARKAVGQTYLDTYALLEEGLDAAQIASKRSLAVSTIYGHFARGIGEDKISIDQVFDKKELAVMLQLYAQSPEAGLTDLAALDERFSISQWRVFKAHSDKSDMVSKD